MSALFALAALLVVPGADVAVRLAPDQPIPAVFTGDPLILELAADDDMIVRTRVRVEGPGGIHSVDLGALTLRAGGTLWEPLPDLPALQGRYQATVTVATTPPSTHRAHFCRVPRPLGLTPIAATVALPQADDRYVHADYALTIAGIGQVQLPAAALQDPAAAFPRRAIAVRTSATAAVTGMPALPAGLNVLRWDVTADHTRPARALLDRWVETPPTHPVVLWPDDPASLTGLASPAARRLLLGWGLQTAAASAEQLTAFRRQLEANGLERPTVYVAVEEARSGAALVQAMVRGWGWGAEEVLVPGDAVVEPAAASDSLVLVAALAHRLPAATAAGPLPGDDVEAWVFRRGAAWRIAYWGDGPLRLSVDDDVLLGSWTDAYGNPLDFPAVDDGILTLSSEEAPRYVTGRQGGVLARAAAHAARQEARAFVRDPALRGAVPEELVGLLRRVADEGPAALVRDDFFALVRAFPYLERAWHAGEMPRHAAVPAMAALTRVVRRVAVVEEGRGQTFLEPLQETLARCRQTSSLYLTRSAGSEAARLRGDWLLAEVNRLVSEAEALDAADRAIEAKAVAALAEWRAASLRYAATATAAPPMAPPVAPPVPVEEEPAAADAATPTPDADAEPDDAEPDDGDQAHAAPEESGDAVAEDAEEAEEPDEPASTEPVRTTFRVQRNEGAWTIARKHGVEFADLLRWNGWSERETLQQGQEYVVYLPPAEARDAESPDDAEPERRVFRVQRGESLYALARKHGVTMDQMRAWNDWGRNPTLRVGQEYIVYLPAAD